MKKALKIVGITALIILIVLIASPFIFQNQIKDMVRDLVNKNVNAKVEFDDVDLSFLSSFPKANVTIDNLKITNKEPFKGETLAAIKQIALDLSIKELFKKQDDDPIIINAITLNEAMVTLKTNKKGHANYDIAKETKQPEKPEGKSGGFGIDIESYAINNSALTYIDEAANMQVYVTELNHSGKGRFSDSVSQLDTKTDTHITFISDSTEYLSNNEIKLEALLDLDLPNSKYTFKDNKAFINQLPLEFHGYVQLLEEGQDVDITFENPGASFKDFLAVVPKQYSKSIENVTTTGNFNVTGKVKGKVTENTIPTLDININSNNGSFKYPDLPKRVEDISLNATIKNTTGKTDDTYVDLKTLNFKIDNDIFKSNATIKNLTKNMLVDANIDGVLNLANISKAYPVDLENELSGLLKAKLNTHFDMEALDTNAYERIKNNGNVEISDFEFSSEDIVNPIHISNAEIDFKPGIISLNKFQAETGKSDINATGTINGLLGFLLSDKKLKGDFDVKSNHFVVSDFMVEGGSEQPINQSTEPETALKIPAFLDCTMTADAKQVLYDDLTLTNVKGQLAIKEEKAYLKDMSSNLFDGTINMNGIVDTKSETPKFNMDLGINQFDISKSFNGLDMLSAIAPIASGMQGKLNSKIGLSGTLGDDFTPVLNSVTGDALAELLTSKYQPKNQALFSALTDKLNFLDFNKLDLRDLKTKLAFKDGKVTVAPFDIKYNDIAITIDGSHTFNNIMNYKAVLNVPAKYLGSEVNRLIGKINDTEVNKIKIPITANLTGSFTSPNVKTDLSSGVTNLTKQLVEIQKKKLLNKGKDKITDILGGIAGNTKSKDSTKTTSTTVGGGLGGVLGGVLKPKDSVKTDTTKTKPDVIKDVLGGIFGKKKKKKGN